MHLCMLQVERTGFLGAKAEFGSCSSVSRLRANFEHAIACSKHIVLFLQVVTVRCKANFSLCFLLCSVSCVFSPFHYQLLEICLKMCMPPPLSIPGGRRVSILQGTLMEGKMSLFKSKIYKSLKDSIYLLLLFIIVVYMYVYVV